MASCIVGALSTFLYFICNQLMATPTAGLQDRAGILQNTLLADAAHDDVTVHRVPRDCII
jgi:hypothetical protein